MALGVGVSVSHPRPGPPGSLPIHRSRVGVRGRGRGEVDVRVMVRAAGEDPVVARVAVARLDASAVGLPLAQGALLVSSRVVR